MYWDIEGLACVLGHRGFGVYWDILGVHSTLTFTVLYRYAA